MKKNSTRIIIDTVLILVAVWIIVIPAILLASMVPEMGAAEAFRSNFVTFTPLIALFFFNYYFLVPRCFFVKGRKAWFFIVNAVIIFGWRFYRIFTMQYPPADVSEPIDKYAPDPAAALSMIRWGFILYHMLVVLIQHLVVGLAFGICHAVRNMDMRQALEDQKRQAAEAELSWLKNQLNPHFLFNTLNNISSLAAIDSAKTQDSIACLSDLLRYVLYESNKPSVLLSSELSFMRDYIDLMKLRLNSLTRVEVVTYVPTSDTQIAPLLFISLVENAFKHGVNARKESFIHISVSCEHGTDLVFRCENSLHDRPSSDMSGSGIGIQNMCKRLELIYPGRYEFVYGPQHDSYVATLTVRQLFNPNNTSGQ